MNKVFCFCISMAAYLQCWCQSFTNASLEAWATAAICETNTPPDGWTNYSNVGIGPDEGRLTLCPSTIPPNAADGNTYARCLAGNPTTGEGMYQFVSGFVIGNVYTISYRFCGSNLWGGTGDCVWHLFLDDIDVNQSVVFSSGNPVWQTNYYTFIATLSTHKFGFRAYTPTFNGGGSAAIDNFMISESKPTGMNENLSEENIFVFPNPAISELVVRSSEFGDGTLIEIYDVLGQRVFSQQPTAESQQQVVINVSSLNAGLYFADISVDNGGVKRIKFIKE